MPETAQTRRRREWATLVALSVSLILVGAVTFGFIS